MLKKVMSLVIAFGLVMPAIGMAASKGAAVFTAKDALTVEEKQVFEGTNKFRLGGEVVYISKDLVQASFTRSKVCSIKHALHYICICKNVFKRRPGTCPCGKALVPSFKHGDVWYSLSRDAKGLLVVKPATAEDCCGTAKTEVIEPAKTEVVEPAKTEVVEPAKTDAVEPAKETCCNEAKTDAVEPAKEACCSENKADCKEAKTDAVEPAKDCATDACKTEGCEKTKADCASCTSCESK